MDYSMDYYLRQNYEDWMSGLHETLWDIPISNLAIPGSHDAMSYCLDINSPIVESEPFTLRYMDRLIPCLTRPAIFKWATTQDKRIVEQLSLGIRFFDLRIVKKPKDSSKYLYFKHVIYTHLTVLDTLMSIDAWLESHPKEIVILACNNLEGMNDELHKVLILSMKKLFGTKLCPRKESIPTLRSLWASGYQVLLSYSDQLAADRYQLWPGIPYMWANQPTAEGVISYLDWQKDIGRPEGFFVAGLNLTASKFYIATHIKQSLRTLTMSNWECLRKWLEKQMPGTSSNCLNIIAGDFVGPIPFTALVIALNKKLQQKNI